MTRGINVILVLYIAFFTEYVTVFGRASHRKLKADISSLELVQILFRHGDRAPLTIGEYPTDPLRDEANWYPYADGFDALTKKGRQQMFKLGKYFRYRYKGFVSKVYSPKEIKIFFYDLDRSIMSALANLAGMWPPTPSDPKSEWNPLLPWQPIPVHQFPFVHGAFLSPCPRLEQLLLEARTNSSFAASFNKRNQALYKYLTAKTGWRITDLQPVFYLYDTLMIQKAYGFTVPDWVDSVYDQIEALAPLGFDPRLFVPNDEAKRLHIGPLLKFLLRNMDTRRTTKMYMISSHDIFIATLLTTLGVFDTQLVPYASSVFLEVHRGRNAQTSNERFVRVFYRNETTWYSAPYELKIPRCDFPCNLKTFRKLFGYLAINQNEWNKGCVLGQVKQILVET